MKKYIFLFILSLVTAIPMLAQPQNNREGRHFNPEEFQNMMRNYIRDKASLTQAEADKIFPIYLEMKTKQMELNGKMMGLKRKTPDANAGSKEYCDLITQITTLNVQLAKVEQTYYVKMCKVVDAKKVYKVMCAEDEFHRQMLWRSQPGNNRRGGSFPGQQFRRDGH